MERKRKGFSLLELLLVMGIIAALIVAAFIVYPKVQSYRNVKIESNNISSLKAEVPTYTSPPHTFLKRKELYLILAGITFA